jgi:hypothetical protein
MSERRHVTTLDSIRAAFQGTKGAERVKKLLDAASMRVIDVPTKNGVMKIPAAVFDVTVFRTASPISLALHPTPFDDAAEIAWSVTELRSGLATAHSYTYPDEALIEGIGKIAIALQVEGFDGFEKRLTTMKGSLAALESPSGVQKPPQHDDACATRRGGYRCDCSLSAPKEIAP